VPERVNVNGAENVPRMLEEVLGGRAAGRKAKHRERSVSHGVS